MGPPPRAGKAAKADVHAPAAFLPYLRANAPALAALFGAASAASAAFAPISAWLAPAMARRFGLTPGDVGVSLGGVLGVGVFAGVALAALAVKLWGCRYGGILGIQIGQYLAAIAAGAAGLLAVATTPSLVYAATGLMFATAGAFFALLPGVWQEIAPAALRARMLAFSGALTTLATAGGPVLVGWLSGQLGDRPDGLLLAVALASAPFMLLSALLMRGSARPVQRLLEKVRQEEAEEARLTKDSHKFAKAGAPAGP